MQIFELHRTVNPTKVKSKTSDIIVCVPDFEVKVVPCNVAFHISPDKLNCIQICIMGRESEKFVSILQYKRVRLKCWFWLVHLAKGSLGADLRSVKAMSYRLRDSKMWVLLFAPLITSPLCLYDIGHFQKQPWCTVSDLVLAVL